MTKTAEIKALRKGMGLTHAGFALAVGCAVQTVRNWERGCAVQPRYRDRLDSVASRQAVDPCSAKESAGQPVDVLVVENGLSRALFAKGRKPLVCELSFGVITAEIAVASWLGAGIKFTLTVAEVTRGELATAY